MMMHVYNNILVPYDGSQPSHLAMQQPFNLSKMNALIMTTKKLYLLYVIQEILILLNYIHTLFMNWIS